MRNPPTRANASDRCGAGHISAGADTASDIAGGQVRNGWNGVMLRSYKDLRISNPFVGWFDDGLSDALAFM